MAKRAAKSTTVKKTTNKAAAPSSHAPSYPRHSSEASLRIPRAILDENAGKPSTDAKAAEFLGLKTAKGPFAVEISSGIKFGFLTRPSTGTLEVTDLAKQILRPKASSDVTSGYQQAVLNAPTISDVYMHYRGENLPDRQFFDNALEDTFKIPRDKLSEFKDIFTHCLTVAKLVEQHDGRTRVLHSAAADSEISSEGDERIEKISKGANVKSTDTCFVMMPFGDPIGKYYEVVYKPAIQKAGLTPIRADDEIFGAGKIMDQVWLGINNAKILVAELTGKNPNVFYELGLAHALNKPVVLVSSNEEDVPFDLRHIRVIYYDYSDPFWGQKLMAKVAENVLSALKKPEEAMFRPLAKDVT